MPSMHSVGSGSSKTLVEEMKLLEDMSGGGGGRKAISSELWHACAGPLVSLPQPGNLVYYFPQGHTEQVTASTKRSANVNIPCYPNLPSQMMCQVHNVTLHADKETDEIYAQITLQPVNSENDVFPIPDFGQMKSKQPNEFFCKTLTASDTSTHGGFSVPRRAAEKLFPPLDHSVQPPSQELIVRDMHDNAWTFRHIYRGQPKRNLLTSGWSVFVSAKRLKAGDSVLFIRDAESQLLVGIRRANRQQTVLPSSVLSADSMHIGVLAAAAHASANRTPFTIYYNPRACPSEFVVPLAKYHRAAYGTPVSIGMRFGMMFEAEDSTKRRYMGTITGISDCDPLRWTNSKWRNLQVEWDEHGCIERPSRVSLWEMETPENLFSFASPTSVLKRPYNSDLSDSEGKNILKRHFQQVPESGDTIKTLLKPLVSSTPGFNVGYHQSLYASLVQNTTTFESPQLPCMVAKCYDQGNQLIPNSVCQIGNQNVYSPFLWQQVLNPQHLKEENRNVHDSVAVVSDSKAHTPLEVVMDDPLQTMNEDQNASTESKNHSSTSGRENANDGSKAASTEVTTSLDENAETVPDILTQSKSGSLDNDYDKCHTTMNTTNSTGQVLNQDPTFLLERAFQMQDQRIDSVAFQSSHEDATPLDFVDPTFPSPDEDQLSPLHKCYMESLGWMLQPSHRPPFMHKPKVGVPSFYGMDNSRTTSADISVVVNPENLTSTCTSELSADQCLLAFGQESSSQPPANETVPSLLEEQPPHFSEQCNPRSMSTVVHSFPLHEITATPAFSHPYEVRDNHGSNGSPNELLYSLHSQVSNCDVGITSTMTNANEDKFITAWNSGLNSPMKGLASNIGSCQDVQSHITSRLTDFSTRELRGFSGGTSSSNIDDNCQLNRCSWKQASPPLRTYTKVQKLGSVGRCIDVAQFRNYEELTSAITCMFGLEDHQLSDPRGSEWKLVYVDYENDMLLVGDDPWEEFVNCVRCIRILSPAEVQQMSHEGLPIIDDPSDLGAFHAEQSPFLDEPFMHFEKKR